MAPLDHLLPVPREIQRRAWECAQDMLEDGLPRAAKGALAPDTVVQLVVIVRATLRAGPDAIGWRTAKLMFSLHRRLRQERAA